MTCGSGWQRCQSGRNALGRSWALLAAVLGAVLVLGAGCGQSSGATDSTGASLRSEAETTAPRSPGPEGTAGVTTSAPAPAIGATGDGAPAPYAPTELDPPLGDPPLPMLAFDAGGAYRLDQNGFTRLVEGPVVELADDGAGGILFQREPRDRVIWWLPAGALAPQDLLVTEEASFLVLEGVSDSSPARQVVYQRVLDGNPDTAVTTLRTFGFDSRAVTEVAVTGGWEHSTQITSVTGGRAAGVWVADGSSGYFLYDLDAGRAVLDPSVPVGRETQGEQVAIDGTGLIGVGPLRSSQGVVDQIGLYRLDESAAVGETIAAFAWDNGYWYPTGLFVDGQRAVISRGASPGGEVGSPLGPIVVDLASGQAVTLPFAANARRLQA
jgi:hypothetical protein